MHRVELKVGFPAKAAKAFQSPVPNAPCGVERKLYKDCLGEERLKVFLMHRVELKVQKQRIISQFELS